MEEMEAGEVAAMYQDGEDAVIMVTLDRSIPDAERCEAVNRLLAQIRLEKQPRQPWLRVVAGSAVAAFFLAHLGQQVTGATGQGLQSLLV